MQSFSVFHKYPANRRPPQYWLNCLSAAALTLLTLGCTTLEPQPAATENADRQYALPNEPVGKTDIYRGANGTVLGYSKHTAPIATTAIVYLHGLAGHGGWFTGAANRLQALAYDVYLLDRRGSGVNRENRGLLSGHIDAYPTWIEDIQTFIKPLRERYPRVFLVGQSWGGKLALAYGIARPSSIDGLVLIAPGLREKVALGPLDNLAAWMGSNNQPPANLAIPFEPAMLTANPDYLRHIENDPLRLDRATARFYQESGRLDEFINQHLSEIRKPTLLLLAGQDQIVDNDAVLATLQQSDPTLLETQIYEDQQHVLQFEAVDKLVADMDAWFKRQK